MPLAILQQRKTKNQIQYMDVKYLSECIEQERKKLRMTITDHRKSQNIQKQDNLIFLSAHILYRMKKRRALRDAFYNYAALTRQYHKLYQAYLNQLSCHR